MGQGVHKEVISVRFESFSSIRIGIVELYGSCGTMEDAMKVFDEMPHRNVDERVECCVLECYDLKFSSKWSGK
ncbi:hypothetical protein ACSBR1_017837 [Camellia fascicularis]